MSKKRTLEAAQFVDDVSNELAQQMKKARETQKALVIECVKEMLDLVVKADEIASKLRRSSVVDTSTVIKINKGLQEHFPIPQLPATVIARNRVELGYSDTFSGMSREKLQAAREKNADADEKKIEKYRQAQQDRLQAKTKIIRSVVADNYDKEFDDLHKGVYSIREELRTKASNMYLYKISSPRELIK